MCVFVFQMGYSAHVQHFRLDLSALVPVLFFRGGLQHLSSCRLFRRVRGSVHNARHAPPKRTFTSLEPRMPFHLARNARTSESVCDFLECLE